MKTNTILKAGLSATAILALTVSGAYAMGNGQGQGGGQGLGKMITAEEKAKLQSMNDEEKQEYAQELKAKYNVSGNGQGQGQGKGQGQGQGQGQAKHSGHDENPADMIKDIPMSDINDTEKELLINQYGEERMARDLYAYAAEKYPNVNTFANITKSEQKHMDTLQVLLDRYDVEAPSDYAADNDLYVTLKNKIDVSEKDAIEVGITVEMVDIDDIVTAIKATDNDDIKIVLTNIGGASYNHLRGFLKAIDNNGYETKLDWKAYISEDDISTKGPIKFKLAEKLESEGVELPEQVSSEEMKKKCANKGKKGDHSEDEEHEENNEHSDDKNHGKATNKEKLNKYKKAIENKYGKTINAFSDEKLAKIYSRIDDLIISINNNSKYTEAKKEKYNYVLVALKEIIEEKLEDSELDIDELLR